MFPFYCTLAEEDGKPVFRLGSDFEDGTSTTVFKSDGKWYYRNPYTGEDRPVPGGTAEVIANWHCAMTEG